jgi:hypothetical protein
VKLAAVFLRYAWMDGAGLSGAWPSSADPENASLVRANLSGRIRRAYRKKSSVFSVWSSLPGWILAHSGRL